VWAAETVHTRVQYIRQCCWRVRNGTDSYLT